MTAIVVIHGVTTLAMVGVIWFVQVVHYPLMGRVGPAVFPAYAASHATRTSWVVTAPMVLEASTAAVLAARPPTDGLWEAMWVGLVLVAVVWASTFGLQVPCHRRLAARFEPPVHRRLVRSNWIRTLAWSARAPVAVAALLAV